MTSLAASHDTAQSYVHDKTTDFIYPRDKTPSQVTDLEPYVPSAFANTQNHSQYMHEAYRWDLVVMRGLGLPVTVDSDSKIPWLFGSPACVAKADASALCQKVFPPNHFDSVSPESFWPCLAELAFKDEKHVFQALPMQHGFVELYDTDIMIRDEGDSFHQWYPSTLGKNNDARLKEIGAHATSWRDFQVSPAFQIMSLCAVRCLASRLPNFERAVNKYINYGFSGINQSLVSARDSKNPTVLSGGWDGAFLHHGIMAMPRLDRPATVYRFLRRADWLNELCLEPGNTFVMNGFVSTSVAPRFVHSPSKFATSEMWLEIRLPAGTPCACIGGAGDEREVLLPHGYSYRLEAKTKLSLQLSMSDNDHQKEYWILSLILQD